MQIEIEFETIVVPAKKKFQWFVIGDYNNHVLAQGLACSEKSAYNQAEYAANQVKEYVGAE